MSVLQQIDRSPRGPAVVDRATFKMLAQQLARRKGQALLATTFHALAESKLIPLEQFAGVVAALVAELPQADATTIAAHFEPLSRQYEMPPEAFMLWLVELAQQAIGRHDRVGGAEVDPAAALQLEHYQDPTDVGIAAHLLARHPEIIWVTQADAWFRWDGQLYERCSAIEVQALLLPIAGALAALLPEQYRCEFDEGEEAGGPLKGEFQAQRVFLKRCKSSRSGASIVAEAKCMRNVPWTAFDRDDFLVSFSDCVLDLRTGQRHAPSPGFFLTRGIRHPFVLPSPEQLARWQAYLDSLGLEPAVVGYMQRLFGYALTGAGTEKAFAWLFGESDSGKSTFAEVISEAFDGYAARIESTAWMRTRGDSGSGHTDSLMPVAGARLVWCDEVKQGSRFDESRMKQATSGCGQMRLSAKGEKGVDVRSRFLLTFTTDVLPSASEGDSGLFNRMRQIRFGAPVAHKVVGFAAALVAEVRPAIMLWLLAGAQAWQAGGLGVEPKALADARADYADEQAWLRHELEELYEVAPAADVVRAHAIADSAGRKLALAGLRTTVSAVRATLESYHRERGVRVEVHARTVGKALRELGCEVIKSNGKVVVQWLKRRMPSLD